MKISNSVKGFLLALVSVIAVSNVYIFSKAALTEVSLPQFGVYWFSFGLIWILLYAWYKKTYNNLKGLVKKQYLILFVIGIIEVVGTYFFFKSIHTISNPTIVSFIGNISPVFVIALSFILLKERFSNLELLGMLLALSGAFVISYKGNSSFKNMFIDGSQYVLYSSMLAAISAVVIKKNIQKIHPIIFTTSRSFFLLFFSIIALNYVEDSLVISTRAVRNIFIGSLLGPFLTVIAGYLALQYIPLSKKAIIASTKGIFVLLGSYLYFNQFPPTIALIGGFVTIVGLLFIAFGKMKHKKSQNN
ncbi:MAG: DMT family transporter [Lutibacter sp.]|uniref:DMT family transporter n=1 Tax=Lutibacter sp. TaxID=1925666 RepID=UPI00385B8AB1